MAAPPARPLPPLPASHATAPDPADVQDARFLSPRAAPTPVVLLTQLTQLTQLAPLTPPPPPSDACPQTQTGPLSALFLTAWGADALGVADIERSNRRAVTQRVAALLLTEDAAAVLGRARCAQASHFLLPEARPTAKFLPALASVVSFLLDAVVDIEDGASGVRWKSVTAPTRSVYLRPAAQPGLWRFSVRDLN